MRVSRRAFLASALATSAYPRSARASRTPRLHLRPLFPDPAHRLHGESAVSAWLRRGVELREPPPPIPLSFPTEPIETLRELPDLRRHFIFEYYPWYGMDPVLHWDQWDRLPPDDLASNYVPRLGAYDSISPRVVEQHAQWIAEAGVGAINVSWWGPDSGEDRVIPIVMDVMRDHDIKVTFHLEPYDDDHGQRYADDILYLVRRYGDRRGWDAFLVLRDRAGVEGPVFKGFRTILPETTTDCHGVKRPVPDYTPDDVWRRQTEAVRRALGGDFDQVTLLADTLAFPRARAAGFDGIAIYDAFVNPLTYAGHAEGASRAGVTFTFPVNPGYDSIEPRFIEPGSCYAAHPFLPLTSAIDWARPEERERAAALAVRQVGDSLSQAVAVQLNPQWTNDRQGFFIVYLVSFNEWHEGHMFEPMKDARALSRGERRFGYHNPEDGTYRLKALGREIKGIVEAPVFSNAAPRA